MKAPLRTLLPFLLAPLGFSVISGCQSAYYSAWETLGVHKRDILVDRVEKGREDQAEAKEQIQTTYEAFQALTQFEGGELEEAYESLNSEYEESVEAASTVSERIESIESVSTALFEEWEGEIEEITSVDLQKKSRDMMGETEERYAHLMTAMRSAESKMEPVLTAFKDQVLFLKHNLNAQAIASLKDSVVEIESDVETLIANMQASIDEADAFIASMGS